jgi:hypothetical protein
MAVVAAAITVERLAPAGERVARAIGAVVVGTGLFLVARVVSKVGLPTRGCRHLFEGQLLGNAGKPRGRIS